MKIENRTELKEYRIECQKKQSADCRVLVCGGTGCLASGSGKIYEKLKELTKDHTGVEVKIGEEIAHTKVMKSGCHGFCEMGPLVRIEPYNYLYIKVKLEDCEEIYNETILGGRPVERLLYKMDGVTYPSQEEIPFYAKQTRLVLKNCGHIDAEHIGGALAVGAYAGIEKALFEMTPEAVIQTIYDSNLRGRGGAGFRTGRKWQQVASQKEKIRYVVCNGDEGDPGAFMDRSIMEGDPHSIVEAMAVCGYSIGSPKGLVYIRAEYPLAIQRLKIAIAQAREYGLLGKNGAGKSTLLYLMSGLLTPKSGKIMYHDTDVRRRLPITLQDMFLVPEEFELPSISLVSYVELNSQFYPRFSKEDMVKYLHYFEMEQDIDLGALSMGQKKKVFMSFALATHTSLLIMDEPTNGLDIPGKSQFRKFIASGMSDDRTIIISTHQVRDIDKILDHVVIMDNSHVLLDASTANICSKFLFVESDDRELAEAAIYTLPSIQGNFLMLPNTDDEESEINLELLFGAALTDPEKIKGMFHPKQNEQ